MIEPNLQRCSSVSRRRFLRVAGGLSAALAVGVSTSPVIAQSAAFQHGSPDQPAGGGIDHIVLVTMENRSFDHFLGWLPRADGRQAGLTYVDSTGTAFSTFRLAPDYQGCGHPDPDHSYTGGRVEYDGGRCDGWLRAGRNDTYSIGYYTRDDLSFLGQAAPGWTTCDRYFAPIMAETYPNRIYQHAAQTDRLTNTTTLSTLPTIWDRLAARGVDGRYYYSDVPFLALWGAKYLPISRPFAAFLADCAAGALPQVAYVDPRFVDEGSGTSGDDHPHADIRAGESFLNQVYLAVTSSPAWRTTALIITFDEWGGFFDHVPPSPAAVPAATRLAGDSDGLRGFRVPCVLISPWARRRFVSHRTYDHTSVLRAIEARWRLAPLSVRDATANSILEMLDSGSPGVDAPRFVVPPVPAGVACPAVNAASDEWSALRALAQQTGWAIPPLGATL